MICKGTLDLQITSSYYIYGTSIESNKNQHIFTLLLYICVKNVEIHVKIEHFS